MGGDSAGVRDSSLRLLHDTKVFHARAGDVACLIGYAGSMRAGQLVEHVLQLPAAPAPSEDRRVLVRWFAGEFATAVRDCLQAGGFDPDDSDGDDDASEVELLVGLQGRLFAVGSDLSIEDPLDGFAAIGTGSEVLKGALWATHAERGEDRILCALRAAERFVATVRGPFCVARQPFTSATAEARAAFAEAARQIETDRVRRLGTWCDE